jgi:glycosyltransferase involved in cell wall biosynthesis
MSEKANLPNISILMPTFNRRKFLPFIIKNLKVQDYPHKKLQLVIHDDGDIPLLEDYETFSKAIKPIKLKYIRNKVRLTIGDKRNRLVQNATNNIVVFMDDDDLYEPTYISHSYHILKTKKAGCVGCEKMIFIYPPYTSEDFYGLDAKCKTLIHEATLMFHKSWYKKTIGFLNNNQAEGAGITKSCKKKTIETTDPFKTMTAVVHGKNTVNKDKFKKEHMKLKDIIIPQQTTDFIRSVCA